MKNKTTDLNSMVNLKAEDVGVETTLLRSTNQETLTEKGKTIITLVIKVAELAEADQRTFLIIRTTFAKTSVREIIDPIFSKNNLLKVRKTIDQTPDKTSVLTTFLAGMRINLPTFSKP